MRIRQNKVKSAGPERQKAYLKALTEELIPLASHLIMRKRSQEAVPKNPIPGFEYFIFAAAPDIARIFELLKLSKFKDNPVIPNRNAAEFFFKDVNHFEQVMSAIQKANQDSGGDEEDFLRILVEEALHIQLLGPGNIFGF